jgi:hypothetical protein
MDPSVQCYRRHEKVDLITIEPAQAFGVGCFVLLFFLFIMGLLMHSDQGKKKLEHELMKNQEETNQLRTKLADETEKQISLSLAVAHKKGKS